MTAATAIWLRNPRTVLTCSCCGGDARLTPGGPTCAAGQPHPAEPRRPAGHGQGLEAPPCPERARPQFPDSGDYRTRMCVRCGRVTALIDLDGVGWCGGDMPAERQPSQAPVARHLQAVGS